MDSTTVDVESVVLADEQVSHLLPVVYTVLTVNHQQIIEEASSNGKYKACPPIPDAAESFVTLIKDRINRQRQEYDGNPEDQPEYIHSAYLKRDDSYFEIEVAVEDLLISG